MMKIIKHKKQQGSILILALMIILILSVAGLAIVKTQETTSETIAQEVLGTRALMAARSGIEASLYQLFPLARENDTSCNNQVINFEVPGLENCSATTTCQVYATVGTTNYYRVESTGECGTGTIQTNSTNIVISSRTLQVEARSIDRDED